MSFGRRRRERHPDVPHDSRALEVGEHDPLARRARAATAHPCGRRRPCPPAPRSPVGFSKVTARESRPVSTTHTPQSVGGTGHGAPGEEGATAWRQPVTDVEALGEPELLELAHVGLERRLLPADARRDVGREGRRPPLDQLAASPSSTGRACSRRRTGASRRVELRDLVGGRDRARSRSTTRGSGPASCSSMR